MVADELVEVRRQLQPFATSLGTTDEALPQIIAACERASKVKNTLIFFKAEPSSPSPVGYDVEQIGQIKDLIRRVVTRGTIWEELVSPDTLSDKSLSWRPFVVTASELIPQSGGSYRAKSLFTSYPVINFTLVYRPGKTVVYFGWGHHSARPKGHVFVSEHIEVVAAFENQWDVLEKDAGTVSPEPAIPTEAIVGTWITAAYSWADASLVRYARVQLSVERRRISGSGSVLFRSGAEPDTHFDFKVSLLDKNRLWFVSYVGADDSIGWYDFELDSRTQRPLQLTGVIDPGWSQGKLWVVGFPCVGSPPADRQGLISQYQKQFDGAKDKWWAQLQESVGVGLSGDGPT